MSLPERKRSPVRTQTCDEDDTLRLAHLFRQIQRRSGGPYWAHRLVERAFAFNGQILVVREAKLEIRS
jgi:hypothetical protein